MNPENSCCQKRNLINEAPELRPLTFNVSNTLTFSRPLIIGDITNSMFDDYSFTPGQEADLKMLMGSILYYKTATSLNGNVNFLLSSLEMFKYIPIKVSKLIIETDNLDQFNNILKIRAVNHLGEFKDNFINLACGKNNTHANPYLRTKKVDFAFKGNTSIYIMVPALTNTFITVVPSAVANL